MASKSNAQKITRPEEVANALGISGKVVRAYLRSTFARPAEAKNTSWSLTPKQVEQTLGHFRARQAKDANANA
jgi:predicted site-specific integrase-resolvase